MQMRTLFGWLWVCGLLVLGSLGCEDTAAGASYGVDNGRLGAHSYAQYPTVFTDTSTHWAGRCIEELRERRVIQGYGDGSFRPELQITRAEFAALLYATFSHLPAVRPFAGFADVPRDHWAYNAIEWAHEAGFLAGYPDGSFKPSASMTRVQAVTALSTGLGYFAPSDPAGLVRRELHDGASVPAWASHAVSAAIEASLIVNHPDRRVFRPNAVVTRGEVAAFFCRATRLADALDSEFVLWSERYVHTPRFDWAGDFNDGLAVAIQAGRFGVIGRDGRPVVPFVHDAIFPFSEDLAVARQGELWGYLDRQGAWVIEAKFQEAHSFSDGRALVQLVDGSFAWIDRFGEPLWGSTFTYARPFSEGLAAVYRFGAWGYVDADGDEQIPLRFQRAESFSGGLAWVMSQGVARIMDKQGNVVTPVIEGYSIVTNGSHFPQPFTEGLALVEVIKQDIDPLDFVTPVYFSAFVDPSGRLAFDPFLGAAQSFSEGVAAVQGADGKWTFVDREGDIAFAGLQTCGLTSFSEGFAGFADCRVGGINGGALWGLVQRQDGHVVLPR
jgi:hypothetical protein